MHSAHGQQPHSGLLLGLHPGLPLLQGRVLPHGIPDQRHMQGEAHRRGGDVLRGMRHRGRRPDRRGVRAGWECCGEHVQ
eukprot:XP_001703929.1 Hypothetical protein GL50803_105823 [Giardia lamblia ATCC 50803]